MLTFVKDYKILLKCLFLYHTIFKGERRDLIFKGKKVVIMVKPPPAEHAHRALTGRPLRAAAGGGLALESFLPEVKYNKPAVTKTRQLMFLLPAFVFFPG